MLPLQWPSMLPRDFHLGSIHQAIAFIVLFFIVCIVFMVLILIVCAQVTTGNLEKRFMHLTNYSVNVKHEAYQARFTRLSAARDCTNPYYSD